MGTCLWVSWEPDFFAGRCRYDIRLGKSWTSKISAQDAKTIPGELFIMSYQE